MVKINFFNLPYFDSSIYTTRFDSDVKDRIYYIITSRASRIPLEFVGKRVGVYNGRRCISFIVRRKMVGYRFGEFSSTKALGSKIHDLKKKKKKSRKK